MARANSLSSSDSGSPCGEATDVASVSHSSASSVGRASAVRPLNDDEHLPRPPWPGDVRAQPVRRRPEVRGGQRAVPDPVEHGLERGTRLGVGRRPVREEGLVLLVEQYGHRNPAVRQRRGHPPLLQRQVLLLGGVVPGREPVRVDLPGGKPLLQVADEPGVHFLLQRAARGRLFPHVQPDDPGRLGPGGLEPAVHVTERRVVLADLVQDRFGRLPERRGQRVSRGQQAAPDHRQRGERVLRPER